jgi:hypothetical protein
MTLGSDADYDIYYRASNVLARLAPNTAASNKFLRMIGTGAAGQAPSWEALAAGDIPDISATYSVKAGNTSLVTVGTLSTGNADAVVTKCTAAEINTGTEATKVVTPDALAGSIMGTKSIQCVVFDWTTNNATGDGKFYMHIPASLNGMNLVTVHARVITAGTTNTLDIQIHNLTDTADMLSTKLTVDSGETGSDTAATPAVINTATDDVATNDVLRIDVDAVHTTPAQGLICTLEFRLP